MPDNITFSNRISSLQPSAIREILKYTFEPGYISFAAGNPSAEAFPVEQAQSLCRKILDDDPVTALQYGSTEGYAPLREQVKSLLKSRYGISLDCDEVIITSGAEQVMDLCAKVLCNEGDTVICENPSFIGSLNAFKSYGCKLAGVDMEPDGMNTVLLEQALKDNPNTKFIYTIPNFQNPTGYTTSLEKRKAIYALAEKYNVFILEDNPYGELRVAGEGLPDIKSFDRSGRVIYAGTFSKIFSPGIRVGYVCAESRIVSKMTVGKQTSDVHTPMLCQMLVSEWLKEYDLDAHINEIRKVYKRKLSLMSGLLKSELFDFLTFHEPQGGLFIWCRLPDSVDIAEFCRAALEAKVAVVPGNAFSVDENEKSHYIRLNFSTPEDGEIEKGVKTLKSVAKEFN